MAGSSAAARRPALPVFDTVATAYRYVWAERVTFLRLSAPWLVLGLLLFVGGPALGLFGFEAAWLLEGSVDGLGYGAVAVAWLRHLVLGEPWPRFGAPAGVPVFRYIFWSLVLGVLAAVPVSVASLIGAAMPVASVPALLAGVVAGVAIAVHLLFVPVGAALGERPAFARSAALVRGNAVRITLGLVAASVPLALFGLALVLLLATLFGEAAPDPGRVPPPSAVTVLGDLVVRLVHYADAAIAASFVAGVWSRLVAGEGPGSAA